MSVDREICNKNGESNFCDKILSDLKAGHPPAKVASRAEVPEILVWAVKLRDLPDEKKLTELGVTTQPLEHQSPVTAKSRRAWLLRQFDVAGSILRL